MARTKQTARANTGAMAPRMLGVKKAPSGPGRKNPRDADVELERSRTPLHRAAMSGSGRILSALLKSENLQIDKQDKSSCTALHYAARNGNVEAVEALLAKGASITAKGEEDRTPLDYAAENGHDDAVKILLANKAPVTHQKSLSDMPLHYASMNGHYGVIEILLASKASPTAQGSCSRTPLHYAAAEGHLEVAKLLLGNGASITAQDKYRKTPLDSAIGGKHWEVSKLLLTWGERHSVHHQPATIDEKAIISVFKRKLGSKWRSPLSETALHLAAHLGLEAMMLRLLCEQGSCPDGVHYQSQPPLHLATISGHPGCVSILLAHGSDIKKLNLQGETALECALKHRQDHIAAIFLEAGATVMCERTASAFVGHGSKTGARLLSHIQSLEALTSSLLGLSKRKHVAIVREYFDGVAPLVSSKYSKQESSSSLTALVKYLLESRRTAPTDKDVLRDKIEAVILEEVAHFAVVFFLLSVSHPDALCEVLAATPTIRTQADKALLRWVDHTSDFEIIACLSQAGYSLPPPPASPWSSDTSWMDNRKWTSLHEACRAGFIKRVRELLQRDDVDIDARGLRDHTALHVAAQNGQMEIVKLLIQHGADLDMKTFRGSTAGDLAMKREHYVVAAWLKEVKNANAVLGPVKDG